MQRIKAQALSLFLFLALCAAACALPGSAYAYTQVEQVVNSGHGSISPSYLVIHETANPGASAYNHVKLYSRGYAYAVHYVMELDGSKVYHTMYDNRKSWSVGNGNNRVVSIELAHATNSAAFNSQWNEAVKWAGDYLKKRGWDTDRMISHNEARRLWGGTDHTDPDSYFRAYGRTWAQFKAAVSSYMASGKAGGTYTSDSGQKATTSAGNYNVGTYHVTASSLNVRTGAGANYAKVSYANLTANAKQHATASGALLKGTTVTVSQVLNGWGNIPSGWVSMKYLAAGKSSGQASNTVSSSQASSYSAGTYRFSTAVKVRTGAGTNHSVTGTAAKGSTRNIQSVSSAGGYYWGKFTNYSGKARFVALGKVGGKAYAYRC